MLFYKNKQRLFEGEAISIGQREPNNIFYNLKGIVNKTYSIQQETFKIEELLSMQFGYCKKKAEEFGLETVSGAVITVPHYFNQFQRQSILDAAELSGIRILQLLNDSPAVALNYAMLRTFNSTEHHIFYDMGAGSTVASLITFKNIIIIEPNSNPKKPALNRTVPQIQVRAVGYEEKFGGNSFDKKIRVILIFYYYYIN